MKNRKNLMVLVLLALFMGVSCADENNATDNDDPWGLEEVKKSFEEADKVIARKEKAKAENAKAKAENAKAKAENEALGSMEDLKAENEALGSMEDLKAENEAVRLKAAAH